MSRCLGPVCSLVPGAGDFTFLIQQSPSEELNGEYVQQPPGAEVNVFASLGRHGNSEKKHGMEHGNMVCFCGMFVGLKWSGWVSMLFLTSAHLVLARTVWGVDWGLGGLGWENHQAHRKPTKNGIPKNTTTTKKLWIQCCS